MLSCALGIWVAAKAALAFGDRMGSPAPATISTGIEIFARAINTLAYLRSLEMAAKDEATPWFIPNDDKQVINLEHVLPQGPEQDWGHFSEEELRIYTRRIGNLALLLAKSNSDLANSDFASKKAVYKDSP
jgi:hypothetical protein